MIELAQLFQDLDQIVMEQEPMVQNIEMKAEEAQDNVVKANVEMDHAITSARAARRKKWWCVLLASMSFLHYSGLRQLVGIFTNFC